MRLREIDGTLVALCAAKTKPQSGDVYIDDRQDHATRVKLERDFDSEGLMKVAPYRNTKQWELMDAIERSATTPILNQSSDCMVNSLIG